MTTPTFTSPPAVTPVRGSATFPADASAWVTFQNAFEPELSVAMPWVAARVADVAADLVLTNADVVTAAASEAAAVGAANFAGAWSGLTGALNIPASVSHSDKVWVLTVNLADVTASEPADGNSDWVSASATGVGSSYFEFLTSGTWTKPSGVTWVFVEAVGGGGGGRNFTGSSNLSGGGGGAYNEGLFLASTVGATETVTIGAGGAGGASGGTNVPLVVTRRSARLQLLREDFPGQIPPQTAVAERREVRTRQDQTGGILQEAADVVILWAGLVLKAARAAEVLVV
jgi:hypothetical protein